MDTEKYKEVFADNVRLSELLEQAGPLIEKNLKQLEEDNKVIQGLVGENLSLREQIFTLKSGRELRIQ